MKLVNLEASFVKRVDDTVFEVVDTLSKADGLLFLCPKCKGEHSILCWSPSVPMTTNPTWGRWNLVGTGLHDVSLVFGSSSVKVTNGCRWHGYVRNGEVTECAA